MTELYTDASTASTLSDAESREQKRFEGRIDDLSARADSGEIAFSDFLTPREQYLLSRYLKGQGRQHSVRFFGGFQGAERRIACFLPDYMQDLLVDSPADSDRENEYLTDAVKEQIAVLEIRGSGYRVLTHRDFLGAVLGLGVERDAIGDIVILPGDGNGREQPRAYLLATEKIAPFLLAELKKIGSDTVRVKRGAFPEDFVFTPKTRPLSDTVASGRLDCVIGALVNTSRDKAQSLIRTGLVEVDYEPVQKTDVRLTPPCMISVRGHGKFRLLTLGDLTKKGRIRLTAEQYL